MSAQANTIDVRDNHRFDEKALQNYLRSHMDGFEGELSIRQFAGGQSNPTFLLDNGSKKYVLRKKPPGKLLPSAHLVEREYRILKALAETDVPVPPVQLLEESSEVIGTPFYIMDYLEGRVFNAAYAAGLTPEDQGKLFDSMNQTLAALHSVDYKKIGLEDYGKPQGYVSRQLSRWTKQYISSKTEEIEAMDKLIAWLEQNLPQDELTTISHGDFRLGNLLIHPTEPKVIAVLDWELSTLGHPFADLAYCCMAYHLPEKAGELRGLMGLELEELGVPSEAEFVKSYAERTGFSVGQLPFFMAFSIFRLAAIAQGVYARALQGNASDQKAQFYGAAAKTLAELGYFISQQKN